MTVEQALAAHLRKIAEQVKTWEARDFDELQASGSRKLTRSLYWHDLENVAAMLEGTHREHRLTRKKAGRGRPAAIAAVDRDLEIARLVSEERKKPGGSVKAGIEAAIARFHVSEEAAERAWLKMRIALEPGNEFVPYLHKLAARGLVKVEKVRPPKK